MKPTEFYEILPDGRYKFRVDHHTINDFDTCNRYFKFTHMPAAPDGQVWRTKSLNITIAIGGWWASVMHSYYNEMKHGIMPSIDNVRTFARERWKEHQMDCYKNDPSAIRYYDRFGGEEGATEMAMQYHLAFGMHHFRDWKVLGAEAGFGWNDEVKLGEDDRVVVYYGGKPDLTVLVRSQNMIMPGDHKTRDTIPFDVISRFKPHSQTQSYIFSIASIFNQLKAEGRLEPDLRSTLPPDKCMVMVCARIKPTDKPRNGPVKARFVPVFVHYTQAELEEWRYSVIYKCRSLRENIERGYFPAREAACQLYSGCSFRRVCSAPPNIRQQVLQADFVKSEPWVPYNAED